MSLARVVFIEPYEKSRIEELYPTEIGFEAPQEGESPDVGRASEPLVQFTPYVGFSPARFAELFSWVERKADDSPGSDRTLAGTIPNWRAQARFGKVRRSIIANDALYFRRRGRPILKPTSGSLLTSTEKR
jgi:hypothetical protein